MTRQGGLLTSVSMFMVKLGVMFSSAISAFVLDWGGYVPDQPQTAGGMSAIQANFVFLPAAGGAVCLAVLAFYRLDKEYPAIRETLNQKRGEGQA